MLLLHATFDSWLRSPFWSRKRLQLRILRNSQPVHSGYSINPMRVDLVIYGIWNLWLPVGAGRKSDLVGQMSFERRLADMLRNSVVIYARVKKECAHLHAVLIHRAHELYIGRILLHRGLAHIAKAKP